MPRRRGGGAAETPAVFFYGEGTNSSSAIQNHVISGTADTLAEEPVEQLALALTGNDLYDRPEAEINTTSFATAHTARDGTYEFSFQLMQTVTWEYWNRFCFEAGLHLFKDYDGLWKVIARDKNTVPVHYFGPEHMRLKRGGLPDAKVSQTKTGDLINEVVLRYSYDPMTGKPLKMKVRSGQYRYSGTCAIAASAGTLTDASATFVTGKFPAFVGEVIYISSEYSVTVAAITSDTVLSVTAVETDDGLFDVAAGATYYGGPSMDAQCIQSFLLNKTIAPLGGEYDPLTGDGGWPSDFIADDDTAVTFLGYVIDWFGRRRLVVEFLTGHNAATVEEGDMAYLRCPLLPNVRDAILLGELDGAITDSDLTVTCSAMAPYYGSLSFRQNDYVAIGEEVVQITSEADVANQDHTITRAAINTVAAAHADGTKMYLLAQTWEVSAVRYDVPNNGIRLRLTEAPWVYSRVGIAMVDDLDYDTLTFEQRVATSWVLRNTGFVDQIDDHSNLSNAI